MGTNTHRSADSSEQQELLTEFYAGFNHFVTNCGDREEWASTLAADVRWTTAAGDGRSTRTYTGIDAVVDNVAAVIRELADHVQALPEQFVETDEGVIVTGAYVGTTEGTTFDIGFVHRHELDDGAITHCRASLETPSDNRSATH